MTQSILRKFALVSVIGAVVFFFSARASGANAAVGHVRVMLERGRVVCLWRVQREDGGIENEVELLSVPDFKPAGGGPPVPWAPASDTVSLRGRRFECHARRGGETLATLVASISSGGVTLNWRASGSGARAVVRIRDASYRAGQDFRYDATFSDEREVSGRVNFDTLMREGTLNDIVALTLHQEHSNVILKSAGRGDGTAAAWNFIDTRTPGEPRGPTEVELSSPLEGRLTLQVEFAAGERMKPVDLRAAVNMGLADDEADNGKGGWTDQGENDMRNFPVGVRHLLGVPFDVIDPAKNAGMAVIVLRNTHRMALPPERVVPLKRKFTTLHILHASAWTKPNVHVADYVLNYTDGTTEVLAVTGGRDVFDWRGGAKFHPKDMVPGVRPTCTVAWVGRNGTGDRDVRVQVLSWRNPHPERKVESITFRSKGIAVPCILAATTSTGAYRATGAAIVPEGKVLPLSPLRICAAPSAAMVNHWEVLTKGGVPATLDQGFDKLVDGTDVLSLEFESPPADQIPRILEFIKAGGRAVVAVPHPVPQHMAALLPVDPAKVEVCEAPEPWAFFIPKDHEHAAFSGLGWKNGDLNYPIPPVDHYYTVGELKEGSEVIATWGEDGPPALISYTIGKGRVTYFTGGAWLGTEPIGKRRLSSSHDYFVVKIFYWTAGKDEDAALMGRLARARRARHVINPVNADCRVMLEDMSARVQFTGEEKFVTRLAAVDAELLRADGWTEEIDQALVRLDFSRNPVIGYGEIADAIKRQQEEVKSIGAALDKVFAGRKDVEPYEPARGRKLRTGTMMNLWFQGDDTVAGEYRYRYYMEQVKELEFDLVEVYVGGYGAHKGTGTAGSFWRWKDGVAGGEVEYFIEKGKDLGWLLEYCRERGHLFLPCIMYGRPRFKDFGSSVGWNKEWVNHLRFVAKYLGKQDVVMGIEPSNEGVVLKKSTDADFQAFLKTRYKNLAETNAALGTSYASIDDVVQPKVVGLGGRKVGPESMTPFGSPERGVWYEHSLFRIAWTDAAYKRDHDIVRSVTNKPINSRDSRIPNRYNGAPLRTELRSKWADINGTHIQTPFDIEYVRGLSDHKPFWFTEYYWHYWGGGSAGLRYRLHASWMLPIPEAERKNLAACTRNFWMATSRGAEAFAIFAMPAYLPMGIWERVGNSRIVWGDVSPKRPIFAHKTQRRVYERMGGEIQGSHTESKVALIEPVATRLQIHGSIIGKTTGTINEEMKRMCSLLFAGRVMNDPRAPSQDLSPYTHAFIPSGLALDRATTTRLLDWTKAGGTLVASLAPGVVDGHTRPDGRIMSAIDIEAVERPIGDYTAVLGGKRYKLPRAVVFSYKTGPAFAGVVGGKYGDGEPCWVETPLGKGKVILVGFASHLSAEVQTKFIIPQAFGNARSTQWTIDASTNVMTFVRHKDGASLIFLINNHFDISDAPTGATITFTRPRDVADLRAGLLRRKCKRIEVPKLFPGECRILKVMP